MSEHELPNKMHGLLRSGKGGPTFANATERNAYAITADDAGQRRGYRQSDTGREYIAHTVGAGAGNWRLIGSGDGGGSDPFGTVAVSSSPFAVNAVTHKGKTLLCGVARTLQLPAASSNADFYFYVKKTATGLFAVTLDPAGSETIDGVAGDTLLTGERGLWKVFTEGTNFYLDLPPTGVVAV